MDKCAIGRPYAATGNEGCVRVGLTSERNWKHVLSRELNERSQKQLAFSKAQS